MRILHTADWHLGKLFYGDYLTDDQAYVLTEQLLPMIALGLQNSMTATCISG